MMRVRLMVVLSTVMVLVLLLGQAAFAGEWAPGKGYNGASGNANSECVFNGQDDPDPEDDFIWSITPAKGRVQSGGQLIAANAQGVLPDFVAVPPGVQRWACNGHLSPLK